jgi:hypothetical protein
MPQDAQAELQGVRQALAEARKDQAATQQLLQDRQITLEAMASASSRALPPELLQGTSARQLADCYRFKEPHGEELTLLTTALAVITGDVPGACASN